jgi:hypothetical protein
VIRLLRRGQPKSPILAVLYWVAVIVVLLAVLFVLFFFLDNYLPGQGMI